MSLQTLINSGFLEDKDIIDPRNNESMTGCVVYRWDNSTNQYKYQYDEECVLPTYLVGDLLKVDVGGGQSQNIYVLEVNGDKITGILDRNLVGPIDYDEIDNVLDEIGIRWNNVIDKRLPNAYELITLTDFYQELSDKSDWENKYFTRMVEASESLQDGCINHKECKEEYTLAGYGDILLLEWITINLVTNGVCNCGSMSYWTSSEETGFISSGDMFVVSGEFFGARFKNNISHHVGFRPIISFNSMHVIEKLSAPEYASSDVCNNIHMCDV